MLDIYQEYSNHIQEIFENSFDYIYLHDKNGNIIDVNNVVVRNLGYSKKEILNMKVTDFLVEESKPEIMNDIKRTLKTGIVNKPRIYKVRKKNGGFLFVEANAIPLRRNGEFYAILGIGHDVSASKKVEQKLIISEKKYRHLFDQSPFSILLFNSEGNLIESNGVLSQRLAAYMGIDFQGKNFIEIASHLQNSKQIIKIFSERLKALQQGEDLNPLEFYITTMNGDKIWLYWQSSRFEIGNQTYIQVIFQDITERKNVEVKLKKQSEDLSTLNGIISLGNESTSLQEFLHKSYDRVLESVGFDRGGVYLYDHKTQHNNLVHYKNVHSDFVAAVEDVDISEGIFSKVFDKEIPFYIEDFSQFMENSKHLGVHSAVIVPLRSKDIYVGSLNLGSPVQQGISQNELELLIAIGKQMGIIIQKFESEKLLLESEEKFRSLFEKADEGIILADIDTEQISSANYKICKMLGYSLEELRNMRFADLHPKESLHYMDEKFEKEIDEFSLVNDIPMKRKDGSVFYCNVNSSQIEISGHSYYLGFFSDVTKRMEAEQKLKESEEKFRSIAEHSEAEIAIIQDGVFKYLNQKALDTLGYIAEEVDLWKPNELIDKIIHPNQREIVIELTERIQSGNKDYVFHNEIPFYDKNGNEIWLHTYTKSITFQGRPAVLSVALNITDKKKAEEELKESEKILKDFIHNATDSISIWDENLNLIEINNVATDPWNSPNEPERGIHMSDLAPLIKQTDRYEKYLEVIKTGIPISFNNIKIPPKVGERYFNIKTFKVGKGLGIIGTEITDHIRFEQKLKESEEKFRTIAEQSFMGIIIIQEAQIKYMNSVLANMTEYPIDEMLKWPDRLITKMVHPDDVPYLLKRLQRWSILMMSRIY